MENASKALIMAGALLISILLISIGLVVFNSTKGVVDQGKQASEIMEIQTFNSKFQAYEGKRTGAEVKNLINLVRASNTTDSEHQVMVIGNTTILNNKIYNVELVYAQDNTTYKYTYSPGAPAMIFVGSANEEIQIEKGYIYSIFLSENTNS